MICVYPAMFNVLFGKNDGRNKITDEEKIMKNYGETRMEQKERGKSGLYLISVLSGRRPFKALMRVRIPPCVLSIRL